MTKIFKQVCSCKNCGNESEMEVTCSLAEIEVAEKKKAGHRHEAHPEAVKVKGTGVCKHCGNEADMWLDI
jgi:hypothetical protein